MEQKFFQSVAIKNYDFVEKIDLNTEDYVFYISDKNESRYKKSKEGINQQDVTNEVKKELIKNEYLQRLPRMLKMRMILNPCF